MTQSFYCIGGAGTGKSTFTAELIKNLHLEYGELVDLHSKPNKKAVVTLRGHSLSRGGMYLGLNRENFPGSDGLDRASSPTGEEWLRTFQLPPFIISEGSTLATRRFLGALEEKTHLFVVHLVADPETKLARFQERGSNQDPKFVAATATRSLNLRNWLQVLGVQLLDVDSTDPASWDMAMDLVMCHLRRGRRWTR